MGVAHLICTFDDINECFEISEVVLNESFVNQRIDAVVAKLEEYMRLVRPNESASEVKARVARRYNVYSKPITMTLHADRKINYEKDNVVLIEEVEENDVC